MQIPVRAAKTLNKGNISKSIIAFFSVGILFFAPTPFVLQDSEAQDGHGPPPSKIGNRQVYLDFKTSPAVISTADKKITLSASFIDKSTGNAVPHVTYIVTVNNPEGGRSFSEVLHGHDGKINLQFRTNNNTDSYKINANYDNLAASYVADFGGVISIDGPIFNNPGNYRVIVEVTGLDFDNTFLPEPIKYEYTVAILDDQSFKLGYKDTDFDLKILSPVQISGVELVQEKKQLIINFAGEQRTDPDNLLVSIDIPNEMMSGPFIASYGSEDIQLSVLEKVKDDRTVTLVLNGTRPVPAMEEPNGDGMTMANKSTQNSENSTDRQDSIIITATNVVPEFPIGILSLAAALSIAVILATTSKRTGLPWH